MCLLACLAVGCASPEAPVDTVDTWSDVWAPPEVEAPSVSRPARSRLERELARYLSLPNQKAFAIAGDPAGRWVGGGAAGHLSALSAIQHALADCRRRIPESEPTWSCRILAVGSRRVDEHPEMKRRYGLE